MERVDVRQGTLYWLLNCLSTYWFIIEVLPTLPSQTPRKNASEPHPIPRIRCSRLAHKHMRTATTLLFLAACPRARSY